MQPRFSPNAEPPTLVCPACGFDYLHHFKVDVFDRQEDEASGLHVSVSPGRVNTRRELDGNPSSRRHGLSVYFECEGCDNISRLDIAQHKGNTRLEVVDLGKGQASDYL